MDLNEAIKILELHNKWRLGDEKVKMSEPKKITEAINIILSEVKKFNKK